MKRKFAFNLAPVKVPPTAKHAAESAPSSHTHSHRRHASKDSVPSLDSPRIIRRHLDPVTERELRVACKLILQNFKPSDAEFADNDPKLDFSGPHKRRGDRVEESHKSHLAKDVNVYRPTGAPADTRTSRDTKKHAHKSDPAAKAYPDLPLLANSSRRRDIQPADKQVERARSVKVPERDVVRSAPMRVDVDSDDAKSLATPLTASTDPHNNYASTAPTSVGSHRGSHQYDSAAATADAQAAEWMRQELDKRRPRDSANVLPDPPSSSHRPSSRASSIKAGIRDYIFPASRSLSRTPSYSSLRTADSQTSGQQLRRSGSMTGWRSWGLQRRTSSRSSSRPGTSNGHVERLEQDKKAEVDLNRKLPPLPSLDTWKDPEEEKKEQPQVQVPGGHIASVMRTQGQPQHQQQRQDYAAAVRKHHRKSGSDSIPLRVANARNPPLVVPVPTQHTTRKHSNTEVDSMMSSMTSTRNLDDLLTLHVGGHAPRRSTGSISHSSNMAVGGAAPNFSRKISSEIPPSILSPRGLPYSNAVEISAGATPKEKQEQKSKLRQVFGGWMLKKDKKDDWMQKVEKKGVKGGIMTQEGAALPPVVRY
ncbi:hypothetical protein DM02DRAFT_623299 [Periconia macrospinosa]|uniref:Uncharacterized protein n=1 Tax=Periconia macrospinosa TaxID=97972 RepID=A0A2V1E8H5_9PLEO|nr:hypothetical protein DM02DRAFT_623299 [Periconia macrospinosa]